MIRRYGLGLAAVLGFWLIIRIDTRPVITCPLGLVPTSTCVFKVEVEDSSDRICFRELGQTDFLACKDGEAGLHILPVKVQPPPGAILFEAITIDTDRDPPLSSHPASTLGFIPNPASPRWLNDIVLLSKRIHLRWGDWLSASPREKRLEGGSMSTLDVPGHKPENRDRLVMGCWAEHEDGSLIHVESVEGSTVVFSIFDLSGPEPVEYRHAMPEPGFKQQFSWPNKHGEKWTWHDKTPFPWQTRIMKTFPAGSKVPSAGQQLSAALRVAQSLGARAQTIVREEARVVPHDALAIMKQLRDALNNLDLA